MNSNYIEIIKIENIEEELISLIEAKSYLRVTGNHDDEFIKSLIKGSISFSEDYLRLSITKKIVTLKAKLNGSEIVLPFEPIISIENIIADDEELDSDDDYELVRNKIIISKKLKNNELKIKFKAGFIFIPETVKQGILLYLSMLYDKEIINTESLETVCMLLSPYRKNRLV